MQKILLLIVISVLAFTGKSIAQGVTTASIRGVITDASGETLPGANVMAIHQPTGTKYGSSTREDGRYTLPNLRVGGPYLIKFSFIGYQDKEFKDVTLNLGQLLNLDVQL